MKFLLFLLLVFSFLLIVTGIFGLISPNKFKTTRKNAIVILLVGVVFFFVYNGLAGHDTSKTTANTEKNKQITSEGSYLDILKKEKNAKITVKDGHIHITLNPNVFSEKAEYGVYVHEAGAIMQELSKNNKYNLITITKPVSLQGGGEKTLISCNFFIDDYKKVDWKKVTENAEVNNQYYKFYTSATSYNIDKSVLNAIGQDEVNNLNQYKK